MIERDLRTKNEFYISPLYNLFIEDNKKILTEPVDKMHVFGTPDEFHSYKDNVTRRVGDKPIAICSDHSGHEAKEIFKRCFEKHGLKYIDFGTVLNRDCDYRDYIASAVKSIAERDCGDYGFGFCRTDEVLISVLTSIKV